MEVRECEVRTLSNPYSVQVEYHHVHVHVHNNIQHWYVQSSTCTNVKCLVLSCDDFYMII